MKSFTNHTPGARGVNVKQGEVVSTRWIEPGATLKLEEGDEVHGPLPDLGKPADAGEKAERDVATLTARVAELEQQLADAGEKAAPAPWMIAAAVGRLDNANADHWTTSGQPKVDAVNSLLGADVSRADIEAAAPDAKRVSQ